MPHRGSIGLQSGVLAENRIGTIIATSPTRRSAKFRFPAAGLPISIDNIRIGAVCVRSRDWADLLCPKIRRAPRSREVIVCHGPPTSFGWAAQDKQFRPRPRIESRHRCRTSEQRSYLHGSTGRTHVPRRCQQNVRRRRGDAHDAAGVKRANQALELRLPGALSHQVQGWLQSIHRVAGRSQRTSPAGQGRHSICPNGRPG